MSSDLAKLFKSEPNRFDVAKTEEWSLTTSLAPLTKAEEDAIEEEMLVEGNLSWGDPLARYEGIAISMAGLDGTFFNALDNARWLVGGDEPSLDTIGRALHRHEDDPVAAALSCYHIPITSQNREAVQSADLLKASPIQHFIVIPSNDDATESAIAIQRGIDAGELNSIKLNGKHSKGAMISRDPETHKIYLLKPGSGKNSPASGVNDIRATQSEREAAFWHVADYCGLGDCFPRADLVLVNGHQTAAMVLLPISYKTLGALKTTDKNCGIRYLNPYRQNGTLFKWAILDYILGNPDRHSQNIMVDPKSERVMLIDHGSAMAGVNFDPAFDDASFIPYYLRAWTGQKFTQLDPEERVHFMPKLPEPQDRALKAWLDDLDEDRIAQILYRYNIHPAACLMRLQMIKAHPGPLSEAICKMWAGAE